MSLRTSATLPAHANKMDNISLCNKMLNYQFSDKTISRRIAARIFHIDCKYYKRILALPFDHYLYEKSDHTNDVTVAVRTSDDPTKIIVDMRNQVHSVDRNLPVSFDTMEQFFSRSIANRRYNRLLIGIFAALAILLSVVRIYGVMSYSVTQSTREIGVRMALGAQQSDVLRLILGNGMTLTVAGVMLGLAAAFGLTRLMASLLFGVSATDTVIFAAVAVLLTSISMLACYVPARRATKVDPMVALRYE